MVKWTTPNLKCTLLNADIGFDYLILTLKQDSIVLEKTIDSSEVIDGIFNVKYTQAETSLFEVGKPIEAQVNIMSANTRIGSNILKLCMHDNLHEGIIRNE